MRIISLFFISFLSVFSGQAQQTIESGNPPIHKIIVREVLQTTAYTYLNIQEDTAFHWLAVPKIDVKAGDTVYCMAGMEMRDFKSKELNRTFPSIYFMDMVSKTPDGLTKKEMKMPEHGKKSSAGKKEIPFVPVAGHISIADIFRDKVKYAGKIVKITGEVIKYNDAIMGRNWAHIQDGSSFGEDYDLVVTLNQSLKTGDTVTLKGMILLDKDFGSGYFFKLIMEDAVIIQ